MKNKHTITSTILYQIRSDVRSLIKAAPMTIIKLDMLELNCGRFNNRYLKKNFKLKRYFKHGSYSDCRLYKHKTIKNFTISVYRRRHNRFMDSNSFKNRIGFNPSFLGDYSELLKFLEEVLPSSERHEIQRLDISFKFPSSICSVESFYTTTDVMNKQISSKYNNTKSGRLAYISFGKRPFRIAIYDRMGKPKHKRPEPFINFEIQIEKRKNKKLPFYHLSEIEKLLEFNPLDTIRFFDQSRIGYKKKNRKYKTARKFLALNYRHGLTMAKTRYQKEFGNYDRIKEMSPELMLKTDESIKSFLVAEYRKQLTDYLNS